MKTAGYDLVLLFNENFLNQLSGALFYSGFLTINGSVDFYNGTLMLEHQVQDYHKDLSLVLAGQVTNELQPFLKMDFRFKLTQEPMLDFIQEASGQRIRFAMGMRIYFWLWQGLEIKFDAGISFTAPVSIDTNLDLNVDLEKADVQELVLKYGSGMEGEMKDNLNEIVEEALHMYFANHAIEKRLAIPSVNGIIKEAGFSFELDREDLGQILVSLDAMRVVSPTVLALGINLMDYHGGDPNQLHDFARNCSLAVGVSELAMQKVFHYVWTHTHISKQLGNDGSLYIVKDDNSISVSGTGSNIRIKKVDDFFNNVSEIATYIETIATKFLTAGFIEGSVAYKGMDFDYGFNVTMKNEPKFDLLGGNRVKIYNMAFDIYLRIACHVTVEYHVEFDTSGWIPDSWTPWEDDIDLYTETERYEVFNAAIHIENLELHNGQGKVEWDESTQTLYLTIEKIDLYWNLNEDGPLKGLPEDVLNWISDVLEEEIVKRIPKFAVSPKLSFDLKVIPWELKMTGRELEITNSEAIVAADFEFEELRKDAYPVAKYIVNVNNGEIHKIGCDSVTDTYEVHQRAYHLLSEALAQGYDGCKKCLPAFHKR
jgi:hypothetical protein